VARVRAVAAAARPRAETAKVRTMARTWEEVGVMAEVDMAAARVAVATVRDFGRRALARPPKGTQRSHSRPPSRDDGGVERR
jgi:hypothetical protein